MQRKNNFLKNGKPAMAMMMALIVIVTIATIMGMALHLSTKTVSQTTDIYLHEQAILLSKSATEYALLRIAQDGPCTHTDDLNFQQDIYDINISLKYVYTAPSPCTAAQTYTTVKAPEQNGSVLMDVTVSLHDDTNTSPPIRYFRRTLQKL